MKALPHLSLLVCLSVSVHHVNIVTGEYGYSSLQPVQKNCSLDDLSNPCPWLILVGRSMFVEVVQPRGKNESLPYKIYSSWRKIRKWFNPKEKKILKQYTTLEVFFNSYVEEELREESKVTEDVLDNSRPTDSDENLLKFIDKLEMQKSFRDDDDYPITTPSVILSVPSPDFHSPNFQIAKEGCVKFNVRGNPALSKSDSLLLWGSSKEKGAKLLWSTYGHPPRYWKDYTVGLDSTTVSLFFNSSSFVSTDNATSHIVPTYQIDSLRIFTESSKCKKNMKLKATEHTKSGKFSIGKSPYLNIKCRWTVLTFPETPIVEVSIENTTVVETFDAIVTHVTSNGFNMCLKKKHRNGKTGWTRRSIVVSWRAYARKRNPKAFHPLVTLSITSRPDITGKTPKSDAAHLATAFPTSLTKKAVFRPFGGMFMPPIQKNLSIFDILSTLPNCHNQYKCKSHDCISFEKVCDGTYDCLSREDEDNCPNGTTAILLISVSMSLLLVVVLLTVFCTQVKNSPASGDEMRLLTNRYTTLVERETDAYEAV